MMAAPGEDPLAAAEPSRPAGGAVKVVEWEDLQQELARLWSLSSALRKAKERKEALAQRLESIIQERNEYLHQSNEIEEMQQKLEARKLDMGDLLLHSKKTAENVKSQTEQLQSRIRSLLVASKTLSAAHQQLQEANKLLAGERGYGHLENLQRMVRARQRYMVAQVATLYPVNTSAEPSSRQAFDVNGSESRDGAFLLIILSKKFQGFKIVKNYHPELFSTIVFRASTLILIYKLFVYMEGDCVGLPSPNLSKPSQRSSFTILGLQLATPPLKKASFFGDKKELQRSATALGYIAHVILLVSSYLDVPLRYTLRFGGSHSYIHDNASSIEPTSSDLASNSVMGTISKPTEFPLFLEGQDSTRAAYAMFLLNKDVEQLLNYIGAQSLGPRHALPNLKELLRIIQAKEYVDT